MSAQNGKATKEHLSNLKILLEKEHVTNELVLAIGNAFVHVMEEIEKKEKRQEQIDIIIFGNTELKIKGLVNDIQPIIKMYQKFGWLSTLFLPLSGAVLYAIFDYLKDHYLK